MSLTKKDLQQDTSLVLSPSSTSVQSMVLKNSGLAPYGKRESELFSLIMLTW
jgi:hypothetical protein